MTPKAVVLYEDSLAINATKYPFHSLVAHCISDELSNCGSKMDPWKIEEALKAEPRNGAGKIRRVLQDREQMERWRKSVRGGPVIAVIDFDRVDDWVGKDVPACKADTKAAIMKEVVQQDGTQIVFLDRNMESVLEQIQKTKSDLVQPNEFVRAISRKELLARDEVFLKAAREPGVRAALMKMPSFHYLVECLAGIVST